MEEFLTSKEVGALFRVLPETVTEWHRTGKLIGRRVGRKLLFDRSTVESFGKGESSTAPKAV